MWTAKKIYLFLILIWLIGIYFISDTFYPSLPDSNETINDRIEYLQTEVDRLQKQILKLENDAKSNSVQGNVNSIDNCEKLNDELQKIKRQFASKETVSSKFEPSLEYEQLRRRIEKQVREQSYFILNQLKNLSEVQNVKDKQHWKNVLIRFGDQSSLLLASIRNLTNVDGYNSWREKEAKRLSDLIQARLKKLQNPSTDCSQVKRLVCDINKGCGYGCQIHHVMHCFHIAYALGRPLILTSKKWQYNSAGFDTTFKPLSDKCTTQMTDGIVSWSKYYESTQVLGIPIIDAFQPRTNFLPPAIPKDLSDRLIKLNGNPFVWFTGQILKYLLRPQPWLSKLIESKHVQMEFGSPIVGIHVRRTDKVGTEADYHEISEYMKYVQEYYAIYQYQYPSLNLVKHVYIATDDPSVFKDARSKFPEYVFHGDAAISQTAQLYSRYKTESLKGVILDIHFLSLCDYLVCTFSSQ
ncbi:unnamed protein product, partial [Didymodactylos carnosus]